MIVTLTSLHRSQQLICLAMLRAQCHSELVIVHVHFEYRQTADDTRGCAVLLSSCTKVKRSSLVQCCRDLYRSVYFTHCGITDAGIQTSLVVLSIVLPTLLVLLAQPMQTGRLVIGIWLRQHTPMLSCGINDLLMCLAAASRLLSAMSPACLPICQLNVLIIARLVR